ncbi:hypothetical protein [Georgenia sp. SUBG003]|uniref:hypothetical protein n=1 Tax=Georgenia sp. SUBG003 TaxID=1497974 RepID=UPI0004D93DB5|nr:hypothetical protein DA06_12800 [Georgenia sp. SUBG003]
MAGGPSRSSCAPGSAPTSSRCRTRWRAGCSCRARGGSDHRTDWLVLRHLLRTDDVRAALWTAQDAAREVAGHENVVLDLGLLRLLGVALQTYVARNGPTASSAAEAG